MNVLVKLMSAAVQCLLSISVVTGCVCTEEKDNVNCKGCMLDNIIPYLKPSTIVADLSKNYIVNFPPRLFQNMTNLDNLLLSSNQINSIDKYTFIGLQNLTNLDLSYNFLRPSAIGEGTFLPLTSLQHMTMRSNLRFPESESYEERIAEIHSIQSVMFDVPPYFEFSTKFMNLPYLTSMSIFDFDILFLTNKTFRHLTGKQFTDITLEAQISVQPDGFFGLRTNNLWIKLLGHRDPLIQISESFKAFSGLKMTSISLSNKCCETVVLGRKHLKYLQNICLHTLRLISMKIRNIDLQSFSEFAKKSACLQELDLSDNPIDTNSAYWIGYLPFLRNLRILKLSNCHQDFLNGWQRGVVYNFTFPQSLQILDIKNCGTTDQDLNIINGTSMQSLTVWNEFSSCIGTITGMPNLTYFDISGWDCSHLNSKMLFYFPKLEIFTAENNNFGKGVVNCKICHNFFQSNSNIRKIQISNNQIRILPLVFMGSLHGHLNSLNLSHNQMNELSFLSKRTFSLNELDISYNKFSSLTEDDMSGLNDVKAIYMLGNPLECSCKTLDFLEWFQDAPVVDIHFVKCILENGSVVDISTVIRNLKDFNLNCQAKEWVIIASILFILLALTIIGCAYKYTLEYTFIKIRLWLKKYKPDETDYEYDAFISYSHEDQEWVIPFYAKMTEKGCKICIDEKDFIAGDWISENIIRAIDASRKTVFIISNNFIKSHWGSYEIEMAKLHAFRKQRENTIIIVMKDDIPQKNIPKELRQFWEKILHIRFPTTEEPPFNTVEMFYQRIYDSLEIPQTIANE